MSIPSHPINTIAPFHLPHLLPHSLPYPELVEIDHPADAADDYVPGDATDFTVKYRVLFEPLKVYSTTVEMIVSCKDRGRWKVSRRPGLL